MTPTARSTLTLAVLTLLVVVASIWGWRAFTEPFPEAAEPVACVDTSVIKGEKVNTEDVLVNVYNGSARQGLASTTMLALTKRGFIPGSTGNAARQLPPDSGVRIISDTPQDPAVQLALRQFRGGEVVRGEELGPGVTVVIGGAFQEMGPPVAAVKAGADTSYCKATGLTLE